MRAAIRYLREHPVSYDASIAPAERIATTATALARRFESMDVQSRHGHTAALRAAMPPEYYTEIAALQGAVRAFIQSLRAAQTNQVTSITLFLGTSQLLFVIELAGLALTSALLLFFSGRTVSDISNLKDKSDRYRRGETLGAASSRHDEVGLLDAALHELVAAVELREGQLESYRLLTEMTPDIMMFVDHDDLTILDANAAALGAYGYERSAFIGMSVAALRAPQATLDAQAPALGDVQDGATIHTLHQRCDGSVFPVAVRVRATEIAGRKTFVVTTRDTTEQRRAAQSVAAALEEAVEASRLKSEFVATMSHEIRTPMHGVIGMSELLLGTPLSPLQQDYAATLKESAHALLAIIDDVLDFSKLEAKRIELETVPFDTADVISGAISIAQAAAHAKGLVVRSYVSSHIPPLRGDPLRLRQILLNLIGNAVKFTAEGSVTIVTSLEPDEDRNVVLKFAVSDTGIGVDAAAREHLFEPFVQGDGSMTRRFGGTGLGLSISRKLAELMGGRIWLAEQDGPGATFCFTAQFARFAGELTPAAPAARALRAEGPARGARILLAEDSALVRRVARFQLEELGHGVDVVENGTEAVAAARSEEHELILMDMRMPQMDGLAATRAIRAAERDTGRHVIIVALTANALDGDRAACIEAGMDDFLAKPLKLEQLRAVLERWLPLAV